jgi:hypothetical protein
MTLHQRITRESMIGGNQIGTAYMGLRVLLLIPSSLKYHHMLVWLEDALICTEETNFHSIISSVLRKLSRAEDGSEQADYYVPA